MIDKKLFKEQMMLLSVNYGFKLDGEDGKAYLRLIYEAIKERSNDELLKHRMTKFIMSMSAQEWNSRFGFGGRPAVKDIMEMLATKIKAINPGADWDKIEYETISQAIERETREIHGSLLN